MKDFQQALDECELTDLSFSGPKYTWTNCWEDKDFIKERLDKGVANQEWRDSFHEAEIRVEFALGLDHLPVVLHLDEKSGKNKKCPIFRYEASWALEEDYGEVVQQAWDEAQVHACLWETLEAKSCGCRNNFVLWQQTMRRSYGHH